MSFPFSRSIYNFLILTGLISLSYPFSSLGQTTRPSADEVMIEKKLIEGEKYTFLGDWEKAEPIFRAILEEDVQNSAACYELSRTLLATNKTADALTYIRKANRIEPDNEWYLLMEADIHEKIGDLHAAMDVYDKLIALQPKKAQYYEMMISFCKRTDDPERLLLTLDRYENLIGVSESITRTRFETLDEMGRTEEALNAINRLSEVYPLNVDYKYLAAAYARKIGQEAKALEYYRKILEISPDDSRAKLALAGTEKKNGDNAGYLQSIIPVISNPAVDIDAKLEELIPYVIEYSKSKDPGLGNALMDVVRQLVAAHPKEAKVYSIQGDIASIAGKNKEAIDAYQKAVSINDNVYVVWEQLIALMLDSQQYDDVLTTSLKAIDIFPNQAYLYYAAGYAAFKKRNFNDAMDHLSEALIMTGKNNNQKVNIYNLMGMVFDELGNMDKSIEAFEASLSINPHNPETLAYYALTLSRRIKQSAKAIEMADHVATEGPKSAMLKQIVAEVYYNQGQYDKAQEAIDFVIQSGADGAAYNLAGDILIRRGLSDEAVAMWQKALEKGYLPSTVKQKIEEHKSQ